MSMPLPNLDDRRWAEMVDQGRTLIPVHAPEWTDHNVHDPGITMMELLAWIAEMDIYRANRVPAAHRRKFLELAGFTPEPPRGARALVGFELAGGEGPLGLPSSIEIGPAAAGGQPAFRTDRDLLVVPGRVAALQVFENGRFEDLTSSRLRGEPVSILGSDPIPGSALHIGLTEPLPVGTASTLYFDVAGVGREERLRLLAQLRAERAACESPDPEIDCEPCACREPEAAEVPEPHPDLVPVEDGEEDAEAAPAPTHHSARLAWELAVAPGVWRRLDAGAGEVADGTRALTLSGAVKLTPPAAAAPLQLGEVAEPLHYLRVRLAGGSFDAAPRVNAVLLNGIETRQEVPVETEWTLAAEADVTGAIPAAGERTGIVFSVDPGGEIDSLEFRDEAPRFRLLEYQAPAPGSPGRLRLEAALLGVGNGEPEQSFELPRALVAGTSLRVFSLENGLWREWTQRGDWTRTSRKDAHFLLDAVEAEITLGDGESGRVLPSEAFLVAIYEATAGDAGDLPAGSLDAIADTPRNRMLAPDLDLLRSKVEAVRQPLGAQDGSAGESLAETAARALEDLESPSRAVTLEDVETLALATPGTRVARAFAIANLHPSFPCIRAEGVVTVLVLPSLPERRPVPSRGLLKRIGAFLAPRRVLGTRIEAAAPEYVELAVRATVKACPLVDLQALRESLIEALDGFFHPLTGGPEGTGWPFGRDVYRSEVLQLLDDADGADHVVSLEFIQGECSAVCGNVCLPPTGLVAAGEHEIEVV